VNGSVAAALEVSLDGEVLELGAGLVLVGVVGVFVSVVGEVPLLVGVVSVFAGVLSVLGVAGDVVVFSSGFFS
jgi:hypothetical protein